MSGNRARRVYEPLRRAFNDSRFDRTTAAWWFILAIVSEALTARFSSDILLLGIVAVVVIVLAFSHYFVLLYFEKRQPIRLENSKWHRKNGVPIKRAVLAYNDELRLSLEIHLHESVRTAVISIKRPVGLGLRQLEEIDGLTTDSTNTSYRLKIERGMTEEWPLYLAVEPRSNTLPEEFYIDIRGRAGNGPFRRLDRKHIIFHRDI